MKIVNATRIFITVALMLSFTKVEAQSVPPYIPKVAFARGIGVPYEEGSKEPMSGGENGYWMGTSIGGFGAGTIMRAYNGDFNRYSLKTGVIKYGRVPANQFSIFERDLKTDKAVSKVLSTTSQPKTELKSWNWEYPQGAGEYYALYPKSWFVYDYKGFPAKASVEQFSPILPDNYKETSYPTGVFLWRVENPTDDSVRIGIMFSWTNMLGWFNDYGDGFTDFLNDGNYDQVKKEMIDYKGNKQEMVGILFNRHAAAMDDNYGQFAIATVTSPGVAISYHSPFNARGDGSAVWSLFSKDGSLDNYSENVTAKWNNELASAICATLTLAPYESREVPMVLSWDFPKMTFGGGRSWYKRYTEYFRKDGSSAWAIAKASLQCYQDWSEKINEWQNGIIKSSDSPDWFKMMLFNQLNPIADAGTGWENGEVGSNTSKSVHHFYFLECPLYPYCNTLDLWFYGSFPLIKFWPQIEKRVMLDYASTVLKSFDEKVGLKGEVDNSNFVLKSKGALPHDLGSPYGDPWISVNAYDYQNPNLWRDLNPKFVLLAYRDYYLSKDKKFLDQCYGSLKAALNYMKKYCNHDNLIEDDGSPDQTFDDIPMKGAASYTGGLWLAALKAGEKIASIENDKQEAKKCSDWFRSAQPAFERALWTGKYYRLDVQSPYGNDIFLDQLAGPWYAKYCGLGDIIPVEHAKSAITELMNNNFAKFGNGDIGGVTVITPEGKILPGGQFDETLVGIALSAASAAMVYGERSDAFGMAKSIYDVSYKRKGYMFRTPAAWDIDLKPRAIMNMRPLVIWAIEMAKDSSSPGK